MEVTEEAAPTTPATTWFSVFWICVFVDQPKFQNSDKDSNLLFFFWSEGFFVNYKERGLESLRTHRQCLFFTPLAVNHILHHTGYYPSFYQTQLMFMFMILVVLVSMLKWVSLLMLMLNWWNLVKVKSKLWSWSSVTILMQQLICWIGERGLPYRMKQVQYDPTELE